MTFGHVSRTPIMDLGLHDRVILVTGAAKGIGEGIVQVLAAEGAIPVIIGRNEDDNLKVFNRLKGKGYEAFYVTAELANPTECEHVVAAVMQKFGRIEGLVNNAGANDSVG